MDNTADEFAEEDEAQARLHALRRCGFECRSSAGARPGRGLKGREMRQNFKGFNDDLFFNKADYRYLIKKIDIALHQAACMGVNNVSVQSIVDTEIVSFFNFVKGKKKDHRSGDKTENDSARHGCRHHDHLREIYAEWSIAVTRIMTAVLSAIGRAPRDSGTKKYRP